MPTFDTSDKRRDPQVAFTTRVPMSHDKAIRDYAQKHGISLAEATRRAIDALVSQEKGEEGK